MYKRAKPTESESESSSDSDDDVAAGRVFGAEAADGDTDHLRVHDVLFARSLLEEVLSSC